MSDNLSVSLHGFNGKAYKELFVFLQGPCKGKVTIVDQSESQFEIIDMDLINSKAILDGRTAKNKNKPIILIGENLTINEECIFNVNKPLTSSGMLAAINSAEKFLTQVKKNKKGTIKTVDTIKKERESRVVSAGRAGLSLDSDINSNFVESFSIDYTDKSTIYYEFKTSMQGFVQSAIKLAENKKIVLKLKFGWKLIIIDPFKQRIWIDATDTQIKGYIKSESSLKEKAKASAGPFNLEENKHLLREEKFQSFETFLWKITLWSSKGRLPTGLNPDAQVFLNRWPNMTRVEMIPNSLRIAALLIDNPISLNQVVKDLGVRHEFVYSFFSSACALGISGQRKTEKPLQPTTKKKKRGSGLFGKIMNKLRGN